MWSHSLPLAALGVAQLASGMALDARQDNKLDSPENFELFAQYSMAAYCTRLTDLNPFTPVCTIKKDVPCPNFDKTETVKEFTTQGLWNIGSYVATNPGKKHIAVVFKATNPGSFDVLVDLAKRQVDTDFCNGCRVHEGFKISLDQVKGPILQTVRDLKGNPDKKDWRVVVTGYSLGAAVATLMAAELRKQGVPCDLYSYGSPRVGNAEFVKFATAQEGFSARITNGNDLVPAIPNVSILTRRYEHIFPEYWYPSKLQKQSTKNRFAGERRVCKSENECSSAYCWKLANFLTIGPCNVQDHLEYMKPFSACPDREGKSLQPDELPSVEELQDRLNKLEEAVRAEEAGNATVSAP
ncbi:hypothetical protein HIM_02175 [Hirsutella minnesotensis 3608]|nr:hypothetical protein HIM_02175 [Hirsutella minnesotensis 3608]